MQQQQQQQQQPGASQQQQTSQFGRLVTVGGKSFRIGSQNGQIVLKSANGEDLTSLPHDQRIAIFAAVRTVLANMPASQLSNAVSPAAPVPASTPSVATSAYRIPAAASTPSKSAAHATPSSASSNTASSNIAPAHATPVSRSGESSLSLLMSMEKAARRQSASKPAINRTLAPALAPATPAAASAAAQTMTSPAAFFGRPIAPRPAPVATPGSASSNGVPLATPTQRPPTNFKREINSVTKGTTSTTPAPIASPPPKVQTNTVEPRLIHQPYNLQKIKTEAQQQAAEQLAHARASNNRLAPVRLAPVTPTLAKPAESAAAAAAAAAIATNRPSVPLHTAALNTPGATLKRKRGRPRKDGQTSAPAAAPGIHIKHESNDSSGDSSDDDSGDSDTPLRPATATLSALRHSRPATAPAVPKPIDRAKLGQANMYALSALQRDHLLVTSPQTTRPFSSLDDVFARLLPYHTLTGYETATQSTTTMTTAAAAASPVSTNLGTRTPIAHARIGKPGSPCVKPTIGTSHVTNNGSFDDTGVRRRAQQFSTQFEDLKRRFNTVSRRLDEPWNSTIGGKMSHQLILNSSKDGAQYSKDILDTVGVSKSR